MLNIVMKANSDIVVNNTSSDLEEYKNGKIWIYLAKDNGYAVDLMNRYSRSHIDWSEQRIPIHWQDYLIVAESLLPNYQYQDIGKNSDVDLNKIMSSVSCPKYFIYLWMEASNESSKHYKNKWENYLTNSKEMKDVTDFFKETLEGNKIYTIRQAIVQMVRLGGLSIPETMFTTNVLARGIYPFLVENGHMDMIYEFLNILIYFGKRNRRASMLESLASSLTLYLIDLDKSSEVPVMDKLFLTDNKELQLK